MKSKFLSLCFLFVAFSGCEEVILEDANETADTIIEGDAYLPDVKVGVGSVVNLAEYLYPRDIEENRNYTFNSVYNYIQKSSAVFDEIPTLFQKTFFKVDNGSFTTVTELKDQQEVNHLDIYSDKIITYEYALPIEMPASISKNERVYEVYEDGVTKRCVVRYIGAKNLEEVLPLYVKNDLKNTLDVENGEFALAQFNFESVMHIYCGASNHFSTDSYYSNKYGRVVNIEKDIDNNLLDVEVVDVLSVIK